MSTTHEYIFDLIKYYKVTVFDKEEITKEGIADTKKKLADRFSDFIERYKMGDVVAVLLADSTCISAVDLVTGVFIKAAITEPEWFNTRVFDFWCYNLGVLPEKDAIKNFFLYVWAQKEIE